MAASVENAEALIRERPTAALFPEQDKAEVVRNAIAMAGRKFPGVPVVVLWDRLGAIGDAASVIDCSQQDPEVIRAEDAAANVYIYACEQDDIGSRFIRRLHQLSGRYLPVWLHQPGMFNRLDAVARFTLERQFKSQTEAGFAKFDHGPGDFLGLFQALSATDGREGVFVEIGCFRGSSGVAVLDYLSKRGQTKTCHFLDVFTGFDYEEAKNSPDALWVDTHETEGVDQVRARLEAYATPTVTVHVHKNNCITDELPPGLEDIVVANLDVDLHEAVLAGLRRLAPRMVRGGIIVVEDVGHTPALIGAKAALDIFLEDEIARRFLPLHMDSGQTFLICIERA